MPDAEASLPFPNEAPAENSIEGEPLRMKKTGRQDAGRPHHVLPQHEGRGPANSSAEAAGTHINSRAYF
jgi:hypothetical protein